MLDLGDFQSRRVFVQARNLQILHHGFCLLAEGLIYLQGASCVWLGELEVMFWDKIRMSDGRKSGDSLTQDIDGALVHDMEKYEQIHRQQSKSSQCDLVLRLAVTERLCRKVSLSFRLSQVP